MIDLKMRHLSEFRPCFNVTASAKNILEIQSQNGLPYQLWVARYVYGSHLANVFGQH